MHVLGLCTFLGFFSPSAPSILSPTVVAPQCRYAPIKSEYIRALLHSSDIAGYSQNRQTLVTKLLLFMVQQPRNQALHITAQYIDIHWMKAQTNNLIEVCNSTLLWWSLHRIWPGIEHKFLKVQRRPWDRWSVICSEWYLVVAYIGRP